MRGRPRSGSATLSWLLWAGLALVLVRAPTARADEPDARFVARLVAQSFFRGLIEGDISTVQPLCASTMSFDGERVRGDAAVKARLEQLADRARQGGLDLKKVEVIPVREAIQRFGPPPERIKAEVRPGNIVALARFNVLGAVAVLGRQSGFWRIHALTD